MATFTEMRESCFFITDYSFACKVELSIISVLSELFMALNMIFVLGTYPTPILFKVFRKYYKSIKTLAH